MKRYFAIHSNATGLSIKDLGECKDYDDADDEARKQCGHHYIWISDEVELRGLFDSIRQAVLGA